MRHPPTPDPREDGVPTVPAWTALLPANTTAISEATTEVPVITPAPGQVAETTADDDSAEVMVETGRAVPADSGRDNGLPDEATATAAAVDVAIRPDDLVEGPPAEEDPPAVEDRLRVEPVAALRPGDLAEDPIAIWPSDQAQRIRDRWRDLQVLFIDEPDEAVAGARSLVTEAVRTLSDRLLAEQEEFDPRRDNDRPDTEALRVAMRRYREFLDRVLAL